MSWSIAVAVHNAGEGFHLAVDLRRDDVSASTAKRVRTVEAEPLVHC
jgi:hypothetical protein